MCAFVFECLVQPHESTSLSHSSEYFLGVPRERTAIVVSLFIVATVVIVNKVSTSRKKTSFWEGDPPGELTVPQTDTGEQVEYTRALERTMSKELGKMTP